MEPELEREVQRGNPNDPGAARIVPTAGSVTSGNFSLAPLFPLSRGRERRLVCSNCLSTESESAESIFGVFVLLRLVGVVQDSIARLSTGVDSKGETFYYPSSVHW